MKVQKCWQECDRFMNLVGCIVMQFVLHAHEVA